MIFQEPMTSFSPVHSIGFQIMEAIRLHKTRNRGEAREIAIDFLDKVGISNPRLRVDEYPHELSGGIRQRAMIAMALCCNPALLVADEPTTALDVTVQAQILDLLLHLQEQFGMAILYITHDLGVIAEICQEVAVMYLGKVVEYADVNEIFHSPLHPYTRRLLKSIPVAGKKARRRLDAIEGTVPVPLDFPDVCGFRSRCQELDGRCCREGVPPLVEVEKRHFVRCYRYGKGFW
jgi:peptide/nickel transport system ATP-binding protein